MSGVSAVGIDLDGTLLTSDKSVSDENIAALKAALASGVQVLIVTGRPWRYACWVASLIGRAAHVIAANGAVHDRIERADGSLAVECPVPCAIPGDALARAVDVLENAGIRTFYKTLDAVYTTGDYDDRFMYGTWSRNVQAPYRIAAQANVPRSRIARGTKGIVKALCYHPDPERMAQARTQLEKIPGIGTTDYQSISFDVTASGVSKGSALDTVLAELGVDPATFMAIGDGSNDLPMFERAALKVAMGNASQSVQAACDVLAPTADENGVAWAVERFCL